MRTLSFIIPIYRSKVWYIVGPKKDYLAWIKRKFEYEPGEDDFDGQASVHWRKDGPKYFVVWLSDFDWRIDDMAKLAHETYHLTDRLSDHHGLVYEGREARAYLHDYLMGRAFNWLKPKKKKKR